MATTNTVNSELQRDVILNQMMRAFKNRILPVLKFANVIRDVPLQGTNIINVPYYPLDAVTPTNFSSSYDFSGSTNTSYKTVTVDKRKYVPLSWTSNEQARQPALDPTQLMMLKVESLADTVLADIFSVITAANYTATAKQIAAAAMDFDQVIDLKVQCDVANWPKAGRMLCLDSGHDAYLMKDTMVHNANYGNPGAATEGFVPRIAGFDYMPVPSLPANGHNLKGFAAYQSAILVAFSPIAPTAAVLANLEEYRTATDPETGLTLEYRRWGNPDADETREVVEVNYGYAVGEGAAIQRITL